MCIILYLIVENVLRYINSTNYKRASKGHKLFYDRLRICGHCYIQYNHVIPSKERFETNTVSTEQIRRYEKFIAY